MSYSDEPGWWRYRNEPDVLWGICVQNAREAQVDVANAGWYLEQNAEIEAYLDREHNK